MGKGLEETLKDLQRQIASPTPAFVVISDSKEEEHVERKATEKEKQAKRLVEIEQLIEFSSKLVEGGFFDRKVGSLDIPIIVPTKSRSKCMMRCKGKEHVEEGSSPTKITQKLTFVKVKEI